MGKTTTPDKLPGYQAPAVHKAFHVLRKVAESRQHLGLTDLAVQLGYSKSTTHGLVHALLREGALVQGADGRTLYLGPAIADLAFSNWNYLKMVASIQPLIDTLRDQIKETMVLGALISDSIQIMAAAEVSGPLKIGASPGTLLPFFAGAAGKVFLAIKSTEAATRMIREKELPQHTPRSIVDENKYLAELEEVRRKGYAIDDEEYLTGVRAVAVGLNNIKGPPMAVWTVGLSGNMGSEKIQSAIDIMTAAAPQLRNTLDHPSGY
jgi:DNA-binding IclR family transcriptional regulator